MACLTLSHSIVSYIHPEIKNEVTELSTQEGCIDKDLTILDFTQLKYFELKVCQLTPIRESWKKSKTREMSKRHF